MSGRALTPLIVRAAAACVALCALSGCGERERVVAYEPGKYKGAPAATPWAATQGGQQQWEKSIEVRARAQNEYAHLRNN